MNLEDIKIKKDPIIIFMGTPDFSVPVLEGLIENYKVKAVVTQPDKPVGRKGELKSPPIKQVAQQNNILCLQPNKINEILQEINQMEPDLIVTCAYGQILPKELLIIPKIGCINVHASLLPKLRGGAPIHRAILEGYSKTGITIMYMAEGMDDGDIISQKEVEIDEKETASSLHDKLKIIGKELLLETLPSIIEGTNQRIKQDESQVTFGFNIKKEDEKIDFNETEKKIYDKVRGLNSWPGAYCILDGKRLKVWECYRTDEVYNDKQIGEISKIYNDGFGVKVSNGEIVFKIVQPEGKKAMLATDFVNGYQDNLVGKILQ